MNIGMTVGLLAVKWVAKRDGFLINGELCGIEMVKNGWEARGKSRIEP